LKRLSFVWGIMTNQSILVLIGFMFLVVTALSCGSSSANLDACIRLCQNCPDGQIITENSDCNNFCRASYEIVCRADCVDKWEKGWECIDGLEACPKDVAENPCNEPEYNFEDECIEPYCQAHEEVCDSIYSQYPWN